MISDKPLAGKKIVLGVSGGIAAYKAAALASKLSQSGAEVYTILTQNATEFITPLTFETLTGRPAIISTFERTQAFEVEHVSLAQKADAIVVAPATANIIAKAAAGIADDMLTTTLLAASCPKLICPAMNTGMYENPITIENLQRLQKFGFIICPPASGRLACGDVGKGRLPEPEFILQWIELQIACSKDLTGKKVLVTAGPTQEDIDPVRFITNHSTGKMGYAIAKAAAWRGAETILITGPTSIDPPIGVSTVKINSAEELYNKTTELAPSCDAVFMTSAVADYRPSFVSDEKIKKKDERLSLPLERTKDILLELGAKKPKGQFLCGFSMETSNLLGNSRKKLINKHADMIVANSIIEEGAGFGGDTNIATLITKEEEIPVEKMTKDALAHVILDVAARRLNDGERE